MECYVTAKPDRGIMHGYGWASHALCCTEQSRHRRGRVTIPSMCILRTRSIYHGVEGLLTGSSMSHVRKPGGKDADITRKKKHFLDAFHLHCRGGADICAWLDAEPRGGFPEPSGRFSKARSGAEDADSAQCLRAVPIRDSLSFLAQVFIGFCWRRS